MIPPDQFAEQPKGAGAVFRVDEVEKIGAVQPGSAESQHFLQGQIAVPDRAVPVQQADANARPLEDRLETGLAVLQGHLDQTALGDFLFQDFTGAGQCRVLLAQAGFQSPLVAEQGLGFFPVALQERLQRGGTPVREPVPGPRRCQPGQDPVVGECQGGKVRPTSERLFADLAGTMSASEVIGMRTSSPTASFCGLVIQDCAPAAIA